MDQELEEDDPVIKEIDVYLSQSLSDHLFLVQYPLHPSHTPYTLENIQNARVCGEGEGLELDIKVRPRGDNYSTSRGENYARMVSLGTNDERGEAYSSFLFDNITLTSTPTPLKTPRYAIAAFQNGSLHLTPLKGLIQLKPTLSHLDKADIGAKKLEVSAYSKDGDTTGSEGEEAKPVTVKFAKQENIAKSQKKVGQKLSFTDTMEKKKTTFAWTEIPYFGIDSEEAEEERRLLLAGDEDQRGIFSLPEEKYLDYIFPREESGQKETGNGTSGLPIGVVSLEQIKKLPLHKQVLEVLRNAHMIQFSRLCSLLGVSGGKMGNVLEAVMRCGVLVQGCWVVASHVIYSKPEDAAKRTARDYILWCFSQRRLVPRKDVLGVVKLSNEEVRQMMQSLAMQRFIPQQSWEFKLEYDLDFIIKNGAVVSKEEEKWRKRHKELATEIIPKSPASVKPSGAGDAPSGSGSRESGKVSKRIRRKSEVKTEVSTSDEDTSTGAPRSATPTRHASDSSLRPQAIAMPTDTVPMDTAAFTSSEDECMSPRLQLPAPFPPPSSHSATTSLSQDPPAKTIQSVQSLSVPIKQEKPSSELMDAVAEICRETVGRGVVGISEIKDRLLLKQMSVEEGHPLREHGIPESLLESGLRLCGAMEVGMACGRKLFALPHDDKCRVVILEMYRTQNVLRKKQILEVLESRGVKVSDKHLLKNLRELCSGKGGQWRLLGTLTEHNN